MSGSDHDKIVEHHADRIRRHTPNAYVFVVKSRALASEIADWLSDQSVTFYEDWLSLPPKVYTFIGFSDLTDATLFKLNWSTALAADLNGLLDG